MARPSCSVLYVFLKVRQSYGELRGSDEEGRGRSYFPACTWDRLWSIAPDHLGQRAVVRGPGLQGVHSPGGDDLRAHKIRLPQSNGWPKREQHSLKWEDDRLK